MPRGEGDYDRSPFTQTDMICMNPGMACGACIFQDGHLAKWCPPAERQAKAELDKQLVEVAA